MRTCRNLLVLLMVAGLLGVLVSPAAAQNTYVALRYWSTNTNVTLSPGGPPTFRAYDNNLISFSVRRDRLGNTPLGVSFNLDSGGQTNFAGTWAAATGGTNTYWNINLHYNFATANPNSNASIFLGYQNARSRSTFGTEQVSEVRGLRGGADFRWRNGPWSVMAWGATGLSPQGQSSQPGFVTATGGGNYTEVGGIVGFTFGGGWTAEGGYRWLRFGTPAGGSFFAADFDTRGWTVGISRMFP